MIPAARVYLDPGDRTSGRHDPPRRCVVVTQWARTQPGRGAPRNVAVRYLDDGSMAVIPFSRRLRRERQLGTGLTVRKLERYLYRDCALLAQAVAERTGWPAVQIFERDDAGEWIVRHAMVRMPDGLLLDAAGPHDDYSGEELFDRRAWDLDIPGSEYLWHDPQVQRDAFALLETIGLPVGGTS